MIGAHADGAQRPVTEDHGRFVIDGLPALVWTAAVDGRLEFVNQTWIDYTGLPLEQVRGRPWLTAHMIHPEDSPPLIETWRAANTRAVRPPREIGAEAPGALVPVR